MDVRIALKQGIARLRESRVPSDTLAAELLLIHALGRNRTWLYAHPEAEVTPAQAEAYFSLLQRRADGIPTQYLTGEQEFWGLTFEVNQAVLIPRPETEHLIEVALDRLALREIRAGRPQKTHGQGLRIADLGTGSGCIAVALAKELPGAVIYATDISAAALAVARRNAERHGVTARIHFVQCNLLEAVTTSSLATRHSSLFFDLIISNPPYVARVEASALPREVRDYEPQVALYGGEKGYEIYAELISQAARRLKSSGLLVLELGHDSLPAVQPLLESSEWTTVGVTSDLAGIPRVIAAERTDRRL